MFVERRDSAFTRFRSVPWLFAVRRALIANAKSQLVTVAQAVLHFWNEMVDFVLHAKSPTKSLFLAAIFANIYNLPRVPFLFWAARSVTTAAFPLIFLSANRL